VVLVGSYHDTLKFTMVIGSIQAPDHMPVALYLAILGLLPLGLFLEIT
jgi:hypothetical protein